MRKENSKITSIAAGICFVVYGIIGLFFAIKGLIGPFQVDIWGTVYYIGYRFAVVVILLYVFSSLGSIAVGLGTFQQKGKLCIIGAITCAAAFLVQAAISILGSETTSLYIGFTSFYQFIFVSSALCWFLIFICFKNGSSAAGIVAGGVAFARLIFTVLSVLATRDNGYNTMKPEYLCMTAVFALVLAYIFSTVAFSNTK